MSKRICLNESYLHVIVDGVPTIIHVYLYKIISYSAAGYLSLFATLQGLHRKVKFSHTVRPSRV